MRTNQQQWTALYLPRLPLESVLRASSTLEPSALAENRHVLDCNEAAFAQGVRPGMTRAAAAALAHALRIFERNPAAEQAALEGAALCAGRYTPEVSLCEASGAQGLLLEVSGSLKLFGSLQAICTGLCTDIKHLGMSACVSSAPTAQGAWLLARGGSSSPCVELPDLERRLKPLPLDVLDCDARTLATLESIGVRTLGEVMALPRPGLVQRFGHPLSKQLARALGTVAEPRVFFRPPETFRAELELPSEVHEAGALVFALHRLILQLGGFLALRKGGVQRLRMELFHKNTRTGVEIGLVRPSCDTDHFMLLSRERLHALALKEPVRRIALSADEIFALAQENLDLLGDSHKQPGDWDSLIEHLRARLGSHAVSGIATEAGHRPETAWRVAEPGEQSPQLEFGTRPLWLLKTPRRLDEVGSAPHCEGPLTLLSGPERIESGWWDGREAVRDYFVARAKTQSLLWIFRERGLERGQWYLHGIFG